MFEVAVTLGLITLLALVMEGTIASTNKAENQLAAVRNALERGQRITYEVMDEIEGSRKLFQGDQIGQDYLAALELVRDPVLPGARLPLFDELQELGPDVPGDPRTGNILLFVRETDAAPAVADPATQKVRYIDIYRFVCVYPRQTNRMVVVKENGDDARDLVVWRSEPFPNRAQIMAITSNTERENVIADLVDRFGMDLAWEPDGTVDAAFYAMTSGGAMATNPTAGVLIQEDVDVSDRGRLVYGNVQLAQTSNASAHTRAVFTKDDPATWKPDGFELKIVGVSGARKVWVHIVIESQVRTGIVIPQAFTVIASPKDL
ncbi:MAG: hypothetical protein QNJ90_11710 [Planctomycetota bacterium]|nr:hypothetical protein [Planctomycetota bacterium]